MEGRRIVVSSGKGGVGKTTVVANLGAGLAVMNRKVAVVDADIGLRNLDILMGLENRIVYDVVDVADGSCKLKQALIKDRRVSNLWLLPAAQTKEKEALSPESWKNICVELSREMDYVLIDSPAGIDTGFKNAVAGASEAIVVATPEVSSIRDADRVIGLLESYDFPQPHLILNRVRPSMVKKANMLSVRDVLDILGIPLWGAIPEDEHVVISTNKGEPVVLYSSPSSTAFKNAVKRMEGEDIAESYLQQQDGFLARFLSLFR